MGYKVVLGGGMRGDGRGGRGWSESEGDRAEVRI